MLSSVEQTRLVISRNTEPKRKAQFGQFLTPARTAQFMASLFKSEGSFDCRLLDAGAGIGSLSSAFLERCIDAELSFRKIEITAFELDNLIHEELKRSLSSYANRLPVAYEILGGDFIEQAVNRIKYDCGNRFTHAILNPPYKKINSNSQHRLLLRQAGIETVNLYSAFVALTLALMAQGGQLVAIIPRSFCNGPYYRLFREFILKNASIHHIHLFASRNKAFKDDDVLQENVIIMLERDGHQGDITVSTSTDNSFTDYAVQIHPFNRIVFPSDSEHFIHVPTSSGRNTIELSPAIQYTLENIGVKVSTGPVVDFRLKKHIRNMPESGTVPLIYPRHFNGQFVEWPKPSIKKPNAIQRNAETEKWLYPSGFYCVVRRFSSKEEKRRIVANVVRPSVFRNAEMLGFENHLNVFHEQRHGVPEALAYGLATFLNTTAVDENFRRFNGHTQVNATDLKTMKYPSRQKLIALGKAAMRLPFNQQTIDHLFRELK